MGKALHLLIHEQLKRPPMSSQPKKALHMGNQPVEKKGKGKGKATGEFALFQKIAQERAMNGVVHDVKHIDTEGNFCTKNIKLEHLDPINFSHIKPKGMNKSLRLDPNNIEIVSKAYHIYEHTQGIHKLEELN